jgi:alkyldihydroxyacetonephosphate synthase
VVTEVALWVHPLAERRVWASYVFPDFRAGLDGVRGTIRQGVRPGVVRLYDAGETAHKFPALDLPAGACLLVLVYEGADQLVEAQVALGDGACRATGGRDLGPEPARQWWQGRFDTSGLVLANSRPGGVADAIEVAAFWRELPAVYEAMMAAARHGAHAYAHVSHVYPSGGGLYVIFSVQASDDEAAVDRYRRLVDDLLDACLAAGGSISHHHGVGRGKATRLPGEHGETGMALLHAVKRAIDPHGIMNPGVLGLEG